MKKILYLLLICALFASCSSDDEKDDTKYLDNKLIEGSWYRIQTGDSIVYTFKNDVGIQRTYNKYTKDEYELEKFNFGSYKITSDEIFMSFYNGGGKKYKVDGDSFWISENGAGKELTQYLRVK